MSRLVTHPDIASAPEASRPLLSAVERQLGRVPNLFRVVASNPAALEGYLNLSGALGKGRLPPATRERIALAVAEVNGCGYCLAAHSFIAGAMAKLDAEEILANRNGTSKDAKAAAAVGFAAAVARSRGHVDDAALAAVRAAGFDDAEIVEIVLHVALNTWTNMLNEVAQTEVDF